MGEDGISHLLTISNNVDVLVKQLDDDRLINILFPNNIINKVESGNESSDCPEARVLTKEVAKYRETITYLEGLVNKIRYKAKEAQNVVMFRRQCSEND